ncbi:ketopantoate reductase family protein [Acidisoma sp. L85]|uniref:ketopantoate reductase family protein n=1 Tax=Acidisoma sp. L85 TaxID=1641850 RepID=UPI00131D7327|nr:2-dehydropantoate 2-reductase [Acidisoma sp. L85]
MKIAVLGGGGAMGGLFGAWLARSGNDVALIDVSKAAIESINGNGVRIDEKSGESSTIPVKATNSPEAVGPVDVIVNFVKCYHTEAAVRSALPMIGPETTVLSLQNGWGNADRIAEVVGRKRVLVGLTYHSATLLAPGHVRHPGTGITYLGELGGETTSRLQAVADALKGAGFEVSVSTRILDEVWKKLALNVCTLPTAALLRFSADQLNQHDGTRAMMRGLLGEVGSVARAQGIHLDEAENWQAITTLLDRAVGARGSMVQDVEAGRLTEIDVINGAIVDAGTRHNIATPLNNSMVWMIKSLQERYLKDAKA